MSRADKQAKIRDEAVEWLVHFSLDGLSEDERLHSLQRFQHWVRADARHRHEYERAEQAWFDLAELKSHPQINSVSSTSPASPTKRQGFLKWLTGPRLAVAMAAVGAVAVLLLSLPALLPEPVIQARYTTRLAEVKTFALADGSHVTLGARSVIQVRMDKAQRQVELLAGDAFFDVAKAPKRPFIVAAGNTQVKVVGTRFDLQRGPREVSIAVVEGVVEVQLTPSENPQSNGEPTSAEPTIGKATTGKATTGEATTGEATTGELTTAEPANVTLTAGQRVAARDNRLTPVTRFDPTQAQDWQTGRFVYEDASLAEIIADANRYSEKPITFGDQALADLTITTVYQVGQQEQMLQTFQLVLPIEVVETPVATILKPK